MKIVADSSCDLNKELEKELNITLVPLTLEVGKKVYKDDKNLNVRTLLAEMQECPTSPKTACPSPDDFIKAYLMEFGGEE